MRLRIEQIGENEGKSMAAGAAMAVVGWWSGYKLGGVLSHCFLQKFYKTFRFSKLLAINFFNFRNFSNLMNIGLNVC